MTIALAMIVRDEADVIGRCLDSVVGLCDSYVIVDTGSVDDTRQIIEAHDLPGIIYDRPWVDFGTNRTELMQLAHGKADWLLLLDADMTVAHDGPPGLLGRDSFMLRHAQDPEYWVKRLVSGNRLWRFVGATHEYITTSGREFCSRLHTITVHHHGDGGHRPEKFERDFKLLTAQLERDPDDARTVFYLANTLRDLDRDDEAIKRYRQRADMGGWDEEVFYSLYQAGKLGHDTDLLWRAWNTRPARAEPLHELVFIFRSRQEWHPAYVCAREGAEIPLPDDSLFLHRWIYDWGLMFELSIAAWWAGHIDEARHASDYLLEVANLPDGVRKRVIANRAYLPENMAKTNGG